MNMKWLFLALVCAACVGFAVADDYTYQALYWQVGAASVAPYGDVASASLYAVVDGERIGYQKSADAISEAKSGTFTEFVGEGAYGWDWGSHNIQDATFFVELWSDFSAGDPPVQGTSFGVSYALLTSCMDRNTSGMPSPECAASTYTFYFAIPEPTSAMLMLLGVAGLALKRKRRG